MAEDGVASALIRGNNPATVRVGHATSTPASFFSQGKFAMGLARFAPAGLMLALSSALAQQPAAPGPIDRIKITDNELSCSQIHGEIGQMERIASQAKGVEDKERTSATAAGAAGTAAEVAGRTGLFGAFGGVAGALFGQVATQTAAGAVQQTSAQSAQQAAERVKQAQARKEHLTGLFLAKDCKASDLDAPGRVLTGAELQKLASAAPAATAEAGAPPPPADAQGASALVGQAAGAARSGLAPVELGIGPGMNFGTLTARGQKVAVAGYRVAFVVRNSASAYAGSGVANIGQSTGYNRTITQAQNKKIEVGLQNVNRQLMQAITDQLYADFLEQLKVAGKTVVAQDELARAPSFAKLERTEVPPNDAYTVSPTGDARHYLVFAPTGLPLYFIAGESLGDKGPFSQGNNKVLGSISTETQSILLIPQVTIDFAEVESSGRSNFRSNAHVDAKPGIALVPMHTIVWAAHANNPIITEMGSRRLEKVVAFPGDYATVKTVDNFNTAGLANSLTRISGLQGVQHFSEKQAYIADPSKFAALALRTGFSANSAFTSVAK